MSRREKSIKRIINNPKNVSFEDLNTVLIFFGWVQRKPKGGSSHHTYTKEGEETIITIPKKKPVKEHYVRRVITILGLEEYKHGRD